MWGQLLSYIQVQNLQALSTDGLESLPNNGKNGALNIRSKIGCPSKENFGGSKHLKIGIQFSILASITWGQW